MAKYKYITRGGQAATFDAANDAAASVALRTLSDRDPTSGMERLADAAPSATAAPAVSAGADYRKLAKDAGAAGLALKDYSSLLGSTADEQKATKDAIAKQFGYETADDFFVESLQRPSKGTVDFYNSAYSAAGLDKILRTVRSRREDLNRALGVINDNPWLDESSRSGKARRLQELANADINTYQNEYDLKLQKVRDLVAQNSLDIGQDEKLRDARLQYLEKAAQDALTASELDRAREYIGDYASGKTNDEKPQTVSVGEGQALYQWNPLTQNFELVVKRPKTYAPKVPKATDDPAEKLLAQFGIDLSKINPNTETREALLARLIAKYGDKIDANDITRKVFETYPDGWEARYRTD